MGRKYNNHFTDYLSKHVPNKIHQYWKNFYSSKKCNCMSRGASEILRVITWAHGENWRRNAHKSENKQHQKKGNHKA